MKITSTWRTSFVAIAAISSCSGARLSSSLYTGMTREIMEWPSQELLEGLPHLLHDPCRLVRQVKEFGVLLPLAAKLLHLPHEAAGVGRGTTTGSRRSPARRPST